MKLKEVIKEKGIKQGTLAGAIGVSQVTFSRYVKGTRDISVKDAKTICTILGCTVDEVEW